MNVACRRDRRKAGSDAPTTRAAARSGLAGSTRPRSSRPRERFLALGYAATTVESIARAAGVSEATVYKTYGGKAAIVREHLRRAR